MRSNGKRLALVILSMFVTFLVFGNFSAWCKDPSQYKVALILDGPINDAGWNSLAYEGLMKIKEKYKCEVAFSENVLVPDAEAALRDYAARGFDLIIGNGFQWGEPAQRIRTQFPKSMFSCTAGEDKAENICSPRVSFNQGGYLAGILAARLTKTNFLAFVGGYPVPNMIALAEAWKIGAQRVNPKIKFAGTYVNHWDDILKAKEATIAQINAGSDIVVDCITASGSIGVVQGAESQGKLAVAVGGLDKSYLAPKNVLATVPIDHSTLVVWQFEQLIKGKLKGELYDLGIADGVTGLNINKYFDDKIPAEVKKEVEGVKQDIISGKLKVPWIVKRSY